MTEKKALPYYEFYSKSRWDNWISQIKASGFSLENEQEAEKCTAIFVNMMDDVILACLKIAARFDKQAMDEQEALDVLGTIQDIVMEDVASISEDIDLMIFSIQDSLACALAAFENYFYDDYDKTVSLKELIQEAGAAENDEELEVAFALIATAGALVIAGEPFEEEYMTILSEESIAAEWLDSIDSIAAAMVGTDSYKNFDDVDDEE